ncbi:MAG TPA: flavodoxin family protein [bacterium]|nr:flavodoxin family protein [bacterium]
MDNLIIYDSVFGNTRQIAEIIKKAIASQGDTNCLQVKDVKLEQLQDLKILIVGSPTRKFSPTGAIKKFLKKIPADNLANVKVAAFDTRISPEEIGSGFLSFLVKIFGYAAKPIARKLQKKGGDLVIEPQGFIVTGTKGPLKEGEIERATKWAKEILVKN